jgi:hypothetical protein
MRRGERQRKDVCGNSTVAGGNGFSRHRLRCLGLSCRMKCSKNFSKYVFSYYFLLKIETRGGVNNEVGKRDGTLGWRCILCVVFAYSD